MARRARLHRFGTLAAAPLLRPECDWYVYMLLNKNSTIPYIGKTNDLDRRLRQHNAEISGGAKRTHRALGLNDAAKTTEGKEDMNKWTRALHIKGFIDERAALHFENRFQRERRKTSARFASSSLKHLKSSALLKGLDALKSVMECDRPTRAARMLSEYGVEIILENDEALTQYTGRTRVEKLCVENLVTTVSPSNVTTIK